MDLRLFNFKPYDVTFRVGIYLFHGLYRPYLDYLAIPGQQSYGKAKLRLNSIELTVNAWVLTVHGAS